MAAQPDQYRIKQKKKSLITAMRQTMGNISAACKLLNIPRKTFYDYRDADPEFAAACAEIEEENVDVAEDRLRQLINGVSMVGDQGEIFETPPNVVATIFYLKTKGKKRGYSEKPTEAELRELLHQQQISGTVYDLERKAIVYDLPLEQVARAYLADPRSQSVPAEIRAGVAERLLGNAQLLGDGESGESRDGVE